jgi:hypothetical protein
MDNQTQPQNELPLRRKSSGWGWFCLAFSPAALLYVLMMFDLLGDNLASALLIAVDVIVSIFACHQILILNPKRSRTEAFVSAIFFGFLIGGLNMFLAFFASIVSGPSGHFW